MSQTSGSGDVRRPLPDRRQVLAGILTAVAAGVVAGCGTESTPPIKGQDRDAGGAPAQASTGLDPDILLVRSAIADEERLSALASETARRHRAVRPVLVTVLSGQSQHIRRLRDSLTALDPPPIRSRPQVPSKPDAAVAKVAQQAALLKAARLASCQQASAGLLAELFGSIAAAHAVTAAMLTEHPPPSARPALPGGDAVDPLQLCLAGEHAAIYGYGLLGGVLSAGVSDTAVAEAARSSYAMHRDRRDLLTEALRTGGLDPVESAVAYDVPTPVTGPVSAHRLAQQLEERCAGLYAQAIAALPSGSRTFVSASLIDCALRGVSWGAEPVAFPGLAAA